MIKQIEQQVLELHQLAFDFTGPQAPWQITSAPPKVVVTPIHWMILPPMIYSC
jgi:hypothetical protein